MMKKRAKGIATLLSSVMLLFVVTLAVFLAVRGSAIEQKSANNHYRTEEAFANAEQGLRAMIAALAASPANGAANFSLPAVAGVYTVSYAYGANPIITSVGMGSGGATRTVTQRVVFTPAKNGSISAPINAALTALGNISIGGSANIDSVKSGGAVSTSGSGAVGGSKSVTNNPNVAQNASDFRVALLDNSGRALIGADGNPVTRAMTTDEYFMYYFGVLCPTAKSAGNAPGCKAEAKATVTASATGYFCSTACNNADLLAQYQAGKRVMWLEQGGMKINANVTLGTSSDPVLILVMNGGSVQINGTSTVYGVVYVDVPDTQTTMNCSCYAQDSATGITTSPVYGQVDDTSKPILGDDTTKPIYTQATTGTKCTSNGGCTDSKGTTIQKGDRYTITYQQKIVGYQQKTVTIGYTTTGATWSSPPVYGLNANQAPACTVNACTIAATKCTPANAVTATTAVGDTSTCSYTATAVSGTNNTPVTIDVLGTWNNSGGGNALIQGAALTSGNFSTTGGINLVKDSGSVSQLQGSPAAVTTVSNGWSDMN
ncbi:hypothetical protein [Cupriavidus sp. BIS7]|uniref:pilus assembly PilX family protein n=1 Tax=Cupriavidus sp. BIS7 TaxID=1217718 RepID=UPI00036931A8|nr:hypothetical protein [Cupriavidus sp. BIS7]